ncbi:MAG: DNA polymerase III subunit gamma/tau [Chloroflexi bacterium]|nr:DNA polymerase III subunit gamma/tau [Chloroflexota bacterium]
MAQAYYRKWRPLGWEEVIGQEHVVRTLRNSVGQGNIAHAYLFSGPRGTGKTTTARIIAKAANCVAEDLKQRPCNECENCQAVNQGRFLDLIEIDAASNTSVDDVRDLREKINFSPSLGKFKVYIIDEVHMLSNAAFNALLKTLEEPPAHAIFVLATTEVYKIPATVLSRCQRHEFRRIPLNFIQAQLKEIAEKEGINVEPAALTAIARQATGSMRDAVSLLDQLASTGSDVTLELTQQVLGTAASLSVLEMIEAILHENTGAGMAVINKALDGGSDPRQLGRQMVDTLRAVLMVKMGNADQVEATTEEAQKLKEFSSWFDLQRLLTAIRCFDQAAQHTNVGWQPGLQLELALARAIETEIEAQPAEPKKHAEKDRPLPAQSKPVSHAAAQESARQHHQPTQKLEAAVQKKPEMTTQETPSIGKPGNDAPITKPGGGGGADAIREKWREIRYKAKEISPETGALLNSCKSMEVVKGKLVLAFSGQMLCSKMENGRNLDNAREAVKAITGADLPIECRVAGENDINHPADPDVEKGGMVGAALSLGKRSWKKRP